MTAVLILCAASLAAQTAPERPPLGMAERALVNALMLPDSDAFRQLLAADAVASLPVEARGADAIVEKWQPFLKSREVTLALTIESSATAASGETGETLGTFAIYGRTAKGMSTTQVGAVSIAWRLVDGQWKIGTLSRTGKAAAKQRAAN
jgi:ketosteroid isomerase-like protein